MNTELTSPASASPKDRRKQQLIDATISCISEYGLSNTTVAKVAKAAGLSTGIVNFYFNSKEQLLLGTLRALSQEYAQAVELAFAFSDQPAEVLSDVIRANFDAQICSPEKIAVWYAFSGESRARREYMSICREHDALFQRSLLRVITALCQQDGDKEFNPEAIARGLEGLIDGYWQEFLFEPTRFDRAAAIATCEDYLAAFFTVADTDSIDPAVPGECAVPPPDDDRSDLLAAWTYHSEEFLALEIEHLFKGQWLLAGHISDLPKPRDYLTFDAVGEQALVVRGNDHQVRAFHNVCRHRGARLVDGDRGRCAHALTCPFHGWTYRLDGGLSSVPALDTFARFEQAENGLVPLRLEIWMGFIFVRFRGDGQSVAHAMKPVEHLAARYQMHNMQPLEDTRFQEVRRYNWKTIHDIDNEGYHVPLGHPSLQQLYGKNYRDDSIDQVPVSYGYLNEQPGKLWSVRNYQQLLPTFDHLPADHQRLWLYIGIFPSMVLALYPDSMEFYMSIPLTTESSRFSGGAYALPDERREARAARYLGMRINRVTDREDDGFVRRLQDGMKSSAFPAPRLSSLEQGVRRLHQKIQRALPVANLANAPPAGTMARVNADLTGEA